MKIHIIGMMLSNDTQIMYISNFHPHFRETAILSILFYKIHDEKCSFLLFSTARFQYNIWNYHIYVNVHDA